MQSRFGLVVIWIASVFYLAPTVSMALAIVVGVPVVLVGAGRLVCWARRRFRKCPHGIRVNLWKGSSCRACAAEEAAVTVRDAVEREKREQETRTLEERRKENELAMRRLAAERVHQLDHLGRFPPRVFEEFVLELYRRLGWGASATPATGDEGIDGIIRRGDKKGIIQCKRYQDNVGQPPVRDLAGAVAKEKADLGILVTTAGFTEQARAWAKGAGNIELVDGECLLELVRQAFPTVEELPRQFALTEEDEQEMGIAVCPRCGNETRIVRGRRGRFIGCTGYPTCRWTQDLSLGRRRHRRRWTIR